MATSHLTVAQTILAQLGGRRFMAMTGAKDFVGSDNTLTFTLPPGFAKDGINMIKISLDWTDTYTIEAAKVTMRPTPKYELIQKMDLVYAENLRSIFTKLTGLDTSL